MLWLRDVQSRAAPHDVKTDAIRLLVQLGGTGSGGCLCADEEPPLASV